MSEPRIHFAINCASISCPKLLNESYNGRKLEKQLKEVTKAFLCNPKKNIIKNNEIDESEKLRTEAKTLLDNSQNSITELLLTSKS